MAPQIFSSRWLQYTYPENSEASEFTEITGPLYPHKSLWKTPRYSSRYCLRVSRAVREEMEELALHWQSRARRRWLSCSAQYLWTMAFILNCSASILLLITLRDGDTVHLCPAIAAHLLIKPFQRNRHVRRIAHNRRLRKYRAAASCATRSD